MKTLFLATVGAAAALVSAPALAQEAVSFAPVTTYGTLGYSNLSDNGVNLDALQARLGARFGHYLGVEGEASGGFDGDHVNLAGDAGSARLRNQFAGYAVGYIPLSPNADLFARVGYGQASFKLSDYTLGQSFNANRDSVNYGAGGQYFFGGGPNGVRLDYTRYDYTQHDAGANNVWSVAYVRKF
ncbi:outer membrane beta-barrel protein [Phenylobacterium montanum]|uniref:Porin family protein n=1 Tax=Phenylobacterium montanum TaxID=2823693 RepID=A0A975G010_9CAUL|nr:outer membrane beta-barrel protein [Caulobacter sp. S6]QUD88089.1 porin family protein [Caulobacter sp. S6]